MTDERRKDTDLRETMERAAELGAERAIKKVLGPLSPHDLCTFDGRAALRADLEYANRSRVGGERLKETAKRAAVTSVSGTAALAIAYAIWSAVTKGGTP